MCKIIKNPKKVELGFKANDKEQATMLETWKNNIDTKNIDM